MILSVIIPTGRPSYGSLIGLEREHLFLRTLKSIEKAWEHAQNFEVIIPDSIWKSRRLEREIDSLGKWSFPWRICHPDSWYLQHGLWALQNANNEGARVATGDLFLFCGDCCEFPPHAFTGTIREAEQKRYVGLLTVYKSEGRLKRSNGDSVHNSLSEAVESGQWNESFIRDSRWRLVSNGPKTFHQEWDLHYGYGCISREHLWHINGWDENFDGDKALGDVEMGSRLQTAGILALHLDPSLYVYENSHNELCHETFPVNGSHIKTEWKPIRSNHDLIYLLRKKGIYRGNDYKLSEDECKQVIRAQITNLPGWPHRSCDDTDPLWMYGKHWIENQPVFKL